MLAGATRASASETKAVPTKQSATARLSARELAAWRGMLVAHSRAMAQLDAQLQAEHGLSVSAYEVLMFLDDAPEHRLRMSDIAERVLLSRSGCTRVVDRLVEQGYVSRCAADTDGRGLYAQLTESGLEKIAAARVTHHTGIRRFFLDGLTAGDQTTLGEIWDRLNG